MKVNNNMGNLLRVTLSSVCVCFVLTAGFVVEAQAGEKKKVIKTEKVQTKKSKVSSKQYCVYCPDAVGDHTAGKHCLDPVDAVKISRLETAGCKRL
jgi:hypothetical protein